MNATRRRIPSPACDTAPAMAANSTSHDEFAQRIAALSELTAQQLRDEWRRLSRGQPPRLSRDLLIRTIAYRMQELAYGGLSKATQRKLDALIRELRVNGTVAVTSDVSLRPGTRLVREWRGRTHTVVVTEEGFEYGGKVLLSLTKIAHAITGAHWSGPRFFGLIRKSASIPPRLLMNFPAEYGESHAPKTRRPDLIGGAINKLVDFFGGRTAAAITNATCNQFVRWRVAQTDGRALRMAKTFNRPRPGENWSSWPRRCGGVGKREG